MPFSPESESDLPPQFCKQAFVIHVNLDNHRHALDCMTYTIVQFLKAHLPTLLDTNTVKQLLNKRHEISHLWLSYNEEERDKALDEYGELIRAVHTVLNIVTPPTIPKVFYTDIIEQQLILNITFLLKDCLTYLSPRLTRSNQLLSDLKEAQFGLAESYKLTAEAYAFTHKILHHLKVHFTHDSETAAYIRSTIKQLQIYAASLFSHQTAITQAQENDRRKEEDAWHKYQLAQLSDSVNHYVDYLETPDKATMEKLIFLELEDEDSGEKKTSGFEPYNSKVRLKLAHYLTSQYVRDRLSALKTFQRVLAKQQTLSPQIIRYLEKTLSELVDAEIENDNEVLSTEREFFRKLLCTYTTLQDNLEMKYESALKQTLQHYLNYLYEVRAPKGRLEDQLTYQDDPDLLAGYKHWQVVLERREILSQLLQHLPNTQFSWITLYSVEHAIEALEKHEINDEGHVLAREKSYYLSLKEILSTLKILYEDYLLKETQDLVQNYRDFISREMKTDISRDNIYANLIERYTSYLGAQEETSESPPLSFDDFVTRSNEPSAFMLDPSPLSHASSHRFFSDKRVYQIKDGYKHYQVVKNRLNCLEILYHELSTHTETTPRLISLIKQALFKLKTEKVEDLEHVLQEESCFYLKLKKHITRLERHIKATGQKDIKELVSHYHHFLQTKMAKKHLSLQPSTTEEKLVLGYQHWQVVKQRFYVINELHTTFMLKKIISSDVLKDLLEKTIEQLKTHQVLDPKHVLLEERKYFESLEQALIKLHANYEHYEPFFDATSFGFN